MRSMRLAGLLLGLALAAGAPRASAATELLPDLDQVAPSDISVTNVGGQWRLGFKSAVQNIGQGPLLVNGHRASVAEPEMTADQIVNRSDGTTATYPGVGKLRFVQSEDHNHWHYLLFDRYELRRPSDYALIVPDEKTGFCLGDRYEIAGYTSPNEPPNATYTGDCGPGGPTLLSVDEGISVGYGDDYAAYLEGQYLDLTFVPAGVYYLVHRTNADKKLKESDYSNDAASLRIRIDTSSMPGFQVLGTCPDADRCPGPPPAGDSGTGGSTAPPGSEPGGGDTVQEKAVPVASRRSATRWARRAVRRELSYRPRGLRASCRRKSDTKFRCKSRWRRRGHRRRARVGVWHSTDDGWEYRLGRIRHA